MFWFFDCEAHGILFPWPGIKPAPCALEGNVLTTGPPGKSSTKSWSNTWTIPNLEYFSPVILSSPSDIDSNVRFTEKFSFQSFYLNFQLPNASYPLPFPIPCMMDFPDGLACKKNMPAMQETQEIWVQSLGLEGPLLEENGNPFQYSWLKNPKDRGAWQATVKRAAKSWTWLSD